MGDVNVISVLVWLLVAFTCGAMDVFSSMERTKQLIGTEKTFLDLVDAAISVEEDKLERLRLIVAENRARNSELSVSRLENPVNSYLLIKRLTIQRDMVTNVVAQNAGHLHLVRSLNDFESRFVVPSEDDFRGVTVSLLRIQYTYNLTPSELLSGNLTGIVPQTKFEITDCLRLAKICIWRRHYRKSLEWVEMAAKLFLNRPREIEPHRKELTEHLTVMKDRFSQVDDGEEYDVGNLQDRVRLLESLVRADVCLQPSVSSTSFNFSEWFLKRDREGFDFSKLTDDGIAMFQDYSVHCRGEVAVNPQTTRHLYCRYETNNSPFLYLQPIKTETLRRKPRVVMYHDIIGHKDIEDVIGASRTQLTATRIGIKENDDNFSKFDYRTASTSWFTDQDLPAAGRLSRLASAVTGLDFRFAEDLQVANYGLGGHYSAHYDYTVLDSERGWRTSRIATFMVYGTPVVMGGATVFPSLNLTIWPREGSAIFWYNMQRSGDLDLLTLHGGCPVLVGNKWVFNKWISPVGQEFRRPCHLVK